MKLWGGRFEKETHKMVEAFTSSIAIDARLWSEDLRLSIAHARMLGKVGVLTSEEAQALVSALGELQSEITAELKESGGSLAIMTKNNAEDIHSEIEARLTRKLGALAGKLHTARSRNDQVATATRLYLRGECSVVVEKLQAVQSTLVSLAENHVETLMPGTTHLQHAQPVSLAHHLLAYFWMLDRDKARLRECAARLNVLPLGSAALAGTSFPLDREMVAKELGFALVSQNSLDAVSDRDFVVEFLSCASLIATHLSRLSEELILWSTPEYGFVELDDAVTTGSSIMPQKKNPDVAELIRGRTGKVFGALIGALTMLKGLPLSYNRDLQEDKEFLFAGLDTVSQSLDLMALMLSKANFNRDRMTCAVEGDFSNATDLADHLVRQGMPFRQAHEVVGGVVRYCIENQKKLEQVSFDELKKISTLFRPSVVDEIQPRAVLNARTSQGGTSPAAVLKQLAQAKQSLGRLS
ncbi:MAG: argininosuccinate lyase [Bdellovibrionota bacterium]